MKAIILGSGPSKDIEAFRNFEGIKIACDKEYRLCVKEGIRCDYAVTLEDANLSHYFDAPHLDKQPIVIVSQRVNDATMEKLGNEDFLIKVYSHPITYVCYNVGLMAWIYAWEKLGCKEIHLNGFDHLYPTEGYDWEHHMWRQMYHDLQEWVPSDVKTIIPDMMHYNIQKKKDAIRIEELKNPGFKGGMDDYIRYRRDQNERFVRKTNIWQDEGIGTK